MQLYNCTNIYVITIYHKLTHVYFDFFVQDVFEYEKDDFKHSIEVKFNKTTYTLYTMYKPTAESTRRITENFINQLYNLERKEN